MLRALPKKFSKKKLKYTDADFVQNCLRIPKHFSNFDSIFSELLASSYNQNGHQGRRRVSLCKNIPEPNL